MKFKAYQDSLKPVSINHGGRHKLIPFAMDDGGRIGAHGHATLRMLAEYVVAKERLPAQTARVVPMLPLEAVAMWVCRWQQRLPV